MRTIVERAALVVAATGLLAGCGSGSGASDNESADDTSPLAELFGWNLDTSPAEQRAQQLAVEEAVATCMRAEGFEYTPVDYEAQFGGGADDEDAELFNDPKAYGEKYGYGIVHNYERWEEPYLSGDGEGSFGPVYDDPNSDYVNSLSESEQQEYYRVLNGDQSVYDEPAATIVEEGDVADDSTVFVPPPLEEQGCYGQAQLEVYGDSPFQLDPEIQERLNDFFTDMQDDPDLQAAEQDWVTCVHDEAGALDEIDGFEVTGPDSMYSYVDGLKYRAQGKEVVPLDPDTGAPVGYDPDELDFGYSSTMDEDGNGWAYIGEDRPIEPDDLEALRARELEIWKVDQGCQEDLDFAGIRRRLEERVAADLKAEFPDLGESSG